MDSFRRTDKSEVNFSRKDAVLAVGYSALAAVLEAPVVLGDISASTTEAKIRGGIAMVALLKAGLLLDKKAELIWHTKK